MKKWVCRVPEKLILPGVAVLVFLGLMIVGIMAPKKTEEEIANRFAYLEYSQLAIKYEIEGKRLEALEIMEKSLKLVPDLPQNHIRMAYLYELIGENIKAEVYYRKFLSIFSKNSKGWYYLGKLLYKQGKYKESEFCLKEAIRWEPTDKVNYDLLARISAKLSKNREADFLFQVALALDQDYGEAHFNFASFLTELRNERPARAHLKRALELGISGPGINALLKHYGLKRRTKS